MSSQCCVTDSVAACQNGLLFTILTTGNIVSIGSQAYKVLLVDVSLEGAQAVRFVDVPKLQLTVC